METKISAVIITFNEERNIGRCLRSLEGVADEIIVVDSFSTDDTCAICSRYQARIISNKWPGYGPQKNVGIEAAAFPYILSIDADEALDDTLRETLLALKQKPMQGVYSFSRLNRYYGQFLRHGLEYPDIKPRLFPKDIVKWNENPVHETPEYRSPQKITRLDGYLLHYTFHNIEEQVHKMNRYSSLGAQLNREKGKKASVWRIVFNPLHTFIRAYFFKGGLLDGAPGFIVAAMHAYTNFLKYSKLWELERTEKKKKK